MMTVDFVFDGISTFRIILFPCLVHSLLMIPYIDSVWAFTKLNDGTKDGLMINSFIPGDVKLGRIPAKPS